MKLFRRSLIAAPAGALFLAWAIAGCSPTDTRTTNTPQGTGGSATSGGTPSSGGSTTPTGGTTGGTISATGGTISATGGTSSTTGGSPATGGIGGNVATGGAPVGGGGAATSGGSPAGGGGAGGTSSGGTGGAAAGASGAGGGSAGSTSNTGFLSEGFESTETGKQPAGWDNFLSYQKNIMNPASDGTLAVVDATRAHSGTKSLHVHGGSNPAMLTRPLPTGTNKLYVRAWFYMTRQLGMNPGANHETLLGIRKETGTANNEVRFGEIKGVIGTNEVPTDDISPKMDQWGKGPVVAANQWACIEVAFIADKPQHELYAWAGDTLVHSITALDQWQNGSIKTADWMTGKFVEFIIGWQSFSSATNDLWIDDLVLSTSKIGCN